MTRQVGPGLDRSRKVALTAVMAALALVANYILVLAPNVELGSSILFVTGFLFGIEMAASCVLIVAMVFGLFNPWGPSIFILEVWIAQVIGWMFFAVAGHIVGRGGARVGVAHYRSWEIGLLGGILTAFYDLVTNLGWSLASGIPFWATLATGIPFTVVHIISNMFIFGIVTLTLEKAVRRHLATALWQVQDSEEPSAKNKKTVQLEHM